MCIRDSVQPALRLDSQSHALPERGGDGPHGVQFRHQLGRLRAVRGDALLLDHDGGAALGEPLQIQLEGRRAPGQRFFGFDDGRQRRAPFAGAQARGLEFLRACLLYTSRCV